MTNIMKFILGILYLLVDSMRNSSLGGKGSNLHLKAKWNIITM